MNKAIVFFVIILMSACAGTQSNLTYISISGVAQGTTYSVKYGSTDSYNFSSEIESLLKQFDMSLSTYVEQSIISKVNRNEDVVIDEWFETVFNRSVELWEETDGAFDLTVGPVVNAYGFGFENRQNITNELIDSLLKSVGMDKVTLKNKKVIKSDPGVILNVNAVAQGFSVDIVCDFFDKRGIENYLVEIGGEVRTKGFNDAGELWKIGIDKPKENSNEYNRELQEVLQLRNRALATSGNYRKFYESDGIKYSHTINPKTGRSVTHNLLSATIVADDCMTADALATACMVMGLEKGKELVANNPTIEAYFISSDETGAYKIWFSNGFEPMIYEMD